MNDLNLKYKNIHTEFKLLYNTTESIIYEIVPKLKL